MSENILQENQELMLDSELEINLTLPNEKVAKNAFVLACNLPAVEYKIQQLLNINPKIWHDLKNNGIIPTNGTYGECLFAVFTYYRNKNDAALAKARINAAKSGVVDPEADSGLGRLIEAEKVQKIRLDKAREQEIHLRNLTNRNELIDRKELYMLVAPVIGNIANVLRNAADEKPELQETIDKCFISLFNAGERLIAQVNEDKLNYVQHMLDAPLDLSTILEATEAE